MIMMSIMMIMVLLQPQRVSLLFLSPSQEEASQHHRGCWNEVEELKVLVLLPYLEEDTTNIPAILTNKVLVVG
jgi:hypothetical protein